MQTHRHVMVILREKNYLSDIWKNSNRNCSMELVEVSCFYVSHCNWNSVVICLGIWISANFVGLISCPWPQTTNLFWPIYGYFLTKFRVLIFLMMLRNARVIFFGLMSSASHMSIWQEQNWNLEVTLTPRTRGNCCWKVSWNLVIKKHQKYSIFKFRHYQVC